MRLNKGSNKALFFPLCFFPGGSSPSVDALVCFKDLVDAAASFSEEAQITPSSTRLIIKTSILWRILAD